MRPLLVSCLFLLLAPSLALSQAQRATQPVPHWQPERFPISYWCGPPEKFTDLDRLKEIKEANFTLVMPPCGTVNPDLNHRILDLCHEVGLKAFIQDPQMPLAMSGSYKARPDINAIVKDYSKHPAMAGYFITDEPSAAAFDGLGEVVQFLGQRDPKDVAFINLFPNYATAQQLGAKDYETYLREFVAKVNPQIISYDHYHFTNHGDRPQFFENLAIARKVAREAKLPFWNIVLCVQHYDYRHLTEAELRFEAMQTLAYGGKGLLWFTYWQPDGVDPNLKHAMINADGSRDPHYEMIKNINADVLAMGDELLRAESIDVFLSKDAPTDSPVTIEAPNATIGLFKRESGEPMSVVASRDYKNAIKTPITVRGDHVELLDPKSGKWLPLGAELNLPPGAAILIRWQPAKALKSDMDIIRSNYIKSIVPSDPGVIDDLKKSAAKVAQSQNADGSWPGIDYTDKRPTAWPLRTHLNHMQVMARANFVARDPKLVESIRNGLAYWLEHDPQNPNWWWNRIGVPQYLGETLLLAQDDLPPDMVNRGVEIMKRSDWSKWTGQNLVWGTGIQVMRGTIQRDDSVIEQAYSRMYEEIRQAPPGTEGIQADWSFHQHGPQFYSGGYGLDFANDIGRFIAYSWGTRFQIPAEQMRIYSSYVLDGEQWMIRGETFDYSAVGREITRAGKAAVNRAWLQGPATPKGAAYTIGNVTATLAALDVPRKSEFASFAARQRGDSGAPELVGNRHFWCSDYMAHRRPGYFASVRMFSDRIWNTEEINAEGRKSHHLADGAMHLYARGDEYRDIFPVWDWGRIPGTTAEQGDLNAILPKGNHEKGKTNFTGGVSDGTYGLCAMDLERGALSAKKAWFFFDDVIVCMGAGITCTSDNPVITSINQCLKHGEMDLVITGFWHDQIAYLFNPNITSAKATTGEQRGRWSEIGAGSEEEVSRDVFSAWIDHGRHPQNASYEYLILPDISDLEATSQRVEKNDLDAHVNTSEIQAVRHKRLGILMAVFRKPGEFAGVSVDQACLVLVREKTVCVSNPRNAPLTVNVSVNGTTLRFDLPSGPLAGSTVVKALP